MTNLKDMMIFKPSYDYIDDGHFHGILSRFNPSTTILKKDWQVDKRFKPLSCDIIFEKDAAVKMRDGVTIYVDVYRPVTDEKVPAYWCEHGYAVCNPDTRGIAHSEGDIFTIGSQEAHDGYDLIEWLGIRDWCNGKVALSGTSYLAFSQWFIAAEQPPHLAVINPEEGLTDAYRDMLARGGIMDVNFTEHLLVNNVHAGEPVRREDVAAEGLAYPFADHPVWQDKIAQDT